MAVVNSQIENDPSVKVLSYPYQQIDQPASRECYPSVGNPPRIKNVSRRKHRSGLNVAALFVPTLRNPYAPTTAVSDLRRNLVALFCPRLKVSARKLGELNPLELLAVSERRGFVSEPGHI